MLNFIYTQVFFYVALAIILFLPGYCLLLAIFGKSKFLGVLEKFIASFGLSIVVVDFIALALNKIGILLTALSSLGSIMFFSAVCFCIYKLKNSKVSEEEKSKEKLFSFSKNQFILVLLLLFFTIFIKTVYLTGTVAPTSTDMGHHMYWAKTIADTGKLTDYEGMPDFIIGEHIIFSEVNLITGASFFSAFPVVVLFLLNILGILTIFILTLRVFENRSIAILSLLFLGVLFAVSSPQAKFVSGGVIGNVTGNFLMPMAFYFYILAFEFLKEKDGSAKEYNYKFFALAIFTTFGLFYTHHLTSFIFLFVAIFLTFFYAALNYSNIEKWGKRVSKVVFSSWALSAFFLGIFFFFFVFTPTYFKGTAIGTAVGAPSKATREGLNLSELSSSVGEPRMILGFLGAVALLIFAFGKKRNFGYVAVFSWAAMLFTMSSIPEIIFINLPSNRIGNYTSYPLAILSAFGFYAAFSSKSLSSLGKNIFSSFVLRFSLLSVLIFIFSLGVVDSFHELKTDPLQAMQSMQETFSASEYLAKNTTIVDAVVKDHNYLTADSWIKLYFMRGYKYPLSRSFFKRYEDETKPRENCTLTMISKPGSEDGSFCFADTGVNFIMINPAYDSAQFQKLKNFNQVYVSNGVGVYYKK